MKQFRGRQWDRGSHLEAERDLTRPVIARPPVFSGLSSEDKKSSDSQIQVLLTPLADQLF